MTREFDQIAREVSRALCHPGPVAFPFPAVGAGQSTSGNHRIVFHFAKPRLAKFQIRVRTRHLIRRLCSRNAPAPPRPTGCATGPKLPRFRMNQSAVPALLLHTTELRSCCPAPESADVIRTFATCSWNNVGNKKNSRGRNEKPSRPSAIPPLRKITDCVPRPSALHTSDHSLKPTLSIFRTAN